ncbi:MAG: hypothetical protein ACTSXQ_03555 [Alphaproteobacteria bacterium]
MLRFFTFTALSISMFFIVNAPALANSGCVQPTMDLVKQEKINGNALMKLVESFNQTTRGLSGEKEEESLGGDEEEDIGDTLKTGGVKKKQKKWKTIVLGTLGSMATGNFMLDPSGCLPKIKLPSGRVNVDFSSVFGGSTTIQCSKPGSLDIQQKYYYNMGNIDAAWQSGKIGNKSWGGKSGSTGVNLSGGGSNTIHIGGKAKEVDPPSTGVQVKSGRTEAIRREIRKYISKTLSKIPDKRKAMKNFITELAPRCQSIMDDVGTGKIDDNVLFRETYKLNCIYPEQNYYTRTSTEIQMDVAEIYLTRMMENDVAFVDVAFNTIPEPLYFAEVYRQKPEVFEQYPDLYLEAPQILAENPHLLDNKPEVKKKLANFLRHYPEKQYALADAWVDQPALHALYAELVPPETVEKRFAQKVEQIFAFLAR